MLRGIIGLVAGLIVGVLVTGAVQAIGHLLFPPPPGLDLSTPEAIAENMGQIPIAAKIAVVVAWTVGVFLGATTAIWIGRAIWPGLIVAAVLLAFTLYTLFAFPHPLWMMIAPFVLTPIATFLAARIVPPPPPDLMPGQGEEA